MIDALHGFSVWMYLCITPGHHSSDLKVYKFYLERFSVWWMLNEIQGLISN
jgi:hypothetical protein